jgi:hypothetical protein
MIDYTRFPRLAGVCLEDSYVLAISETGGQLTFDLDAALAPDSQAYHAPRSGEPYCYAYGTLVFPNVTGIEWVKRSDARYTDASGEENLGNIDILSVDQEAFVAEGDWGGVRIFSDPPRFELSG